MEGVGTPSMKASDEEYRFHRRLLDPNDLTAPSDFADWIYADLVHRVRTRVAPGADPALVEEAAGNALLKYIDSPHRYDPNASGLRGYLTMAAYRDYLNESAKEQRRAALPLAMTEDAPEREVADPVQDIERLMGQIEIEPLLEAIDEAFPDPIDRQVVALLLDGERRYGAYAEVLQITHLPADARDAEVKRAKDRIAKRLRRIASKHYDR